jgi:hypothetical protein
MWKSLWMNSIGQNEGGFNAAGIRPVTCIKPLKFEKVMDGGLGGIVFSAK